MRTYALISQKGGAGKSTLARQLAVLAAEAGPSLLIDRDPQATTSKWLERRQKLRPDLDNPNLLDLEGRKLPEVVTALKRQPGSILIDTRPAVQEPEAEAARVADIVIVPVRPSLDDLEAVGDTLTMLRRLGRKTVLVVNAAKNAGRARDARAALAAYPVAVCPVHLGDRAVYLDASMEGRGVIEMQGVQAKAAADELRQLWAWIEEQANG